MTDPSHALGQKPYDQCELLYQAAVNQEERAYALGCFLHGATDAIAHHYVNYLSGETFTLTPITNAREQDLEILLQHGVEDRVLGSVADVCGCSCRSVCACPGAVHVVRAAS